MRRILPPANPELITRRHFPSSSARINAWSAWNACWSVWSGKRPRILKSCWWMAVERIVTPTGIWPRWSRDSKAISTSGFWLRRKDSPANGTGLWPRQRGRRFSFLTTTSPSSLTLSLGHCPCSRTRIGGISGDSRASIPCIMDRDSIGAGICARLSGSRPVLLPGASIDGDDPFPSVSCSPSRACVKWVTCRDTACYSAVRPSATCVSMKHCRPMAGRIATSHGGSAVTPGWPCAGTGNSSTIALPNRETRVSSGSIRPALGRDAFSGRTRRGSGNTCC